MPTTKICQLNNIIQHILNFHFLESCPAIEISKNIPEYILKDSEKRPGYPLSRLMRQGKIVGAKKGDNGRWIIHRQYYYSNEYSVRQVSTLCGYKTTKPIYDHIKSKTIPFRKDKDGQIFFLEREIINWIKSNPKVPLAKPTLSVFDIYFQLRALEKLEAIKHQINNFFSKVDSFEDSKKELKKISDMLSRNYIEYFLREDLLEFLGDNDLHINKYDYSLEKYRYEEDY